MSYIYKRGKGAKRRVFHLGLHDALTGEPLLVALCASRNVRDLSAEARTQFDACEQQYKAGGAFLLNVAAVWGRKLADENDRLKVDAARLLKLAEATHHLATYYKDRLSEMEEAATPLTSQTWWQDRLYDRPASVVLVAQWIAECASHVLRSALGETQPSEPQHKADSQGWCVYCGADDADEFAWNTTCPGPKRRRKRTPDSAVPTESEPKMYRVPELRQPNPQTSDSGLPEQENAEAQSDENKPQGACRDGAHDASAPAPVSDGMVLRDMAKTDNLSESQVGAPLHRTSQRGTPSHPLVSDVVRKVKELLPEVAWDSVNSVSAEREIIEAVEKLERRYRETQKLVMRHAQNAEQAEALLRRWRRGRSYMIPAEHNNVEADTDAYFAAREGSRNE